MVVPAFWPRSVRARRSEWIDSFTHTEADFRASFRDIRRINRFLGGTSVIQKSLTHYIRNGTTILDVGTGLADIPEALCRSAEKTGKRLAIIGIDLNRKVLNAARADSPSVSLARASGTCLPFSDESFDVVICSLTFHHLDESEMVAVLREMVRVSRQVVVVNDLRRGYVPAALIWLVTRLVRMHRLTRHDAPLSVMRSLTIPEYRDLLERSGLKHGEVYAHPFWRAAIVVRKPA